MQVREEHAIYGSMLWGMIREYRSRYIHVKMQSQIESDLHDLCLVHGDAVVWVFGELVQGTGSGSMHQWVRGVQVGHQWGNGLCLAKCNTIITPHAAPGHKEGAQSWCTHIYVDTCH